MADWVPPRELDLVDLAMIWLTVLSDTAKQTAFGWDAAECQATAAKIGAFFNARAAYERDNSTANHSEHRIRAVNRGRGETGPWFPVEEAVIG
jgi:hypothetical protein